MIKIALFEPEIPQNTGNIARLCAGTGVELILVGPLGFSLSEKHVRRAGLDYWDSVTVTQVESIDQFFIQYPSSDFSYAFLSKFADKRYTDIYDDRTVPDQILIFGSESSGLPPSVHEAYPDQLYKIPMTDAIRSLNLANSAAVVLYEILRRDDFPLS